MILTTWNMQGGNAATEVKWQTGVANMLTNSLVPPDAICLQEAGGVPRSALHRVTMPFVDPLFGPTNVDVYDWLVTRRRPGYTIVFHRWDTAGNRVNTAIVSRNLPHPANVTLVWGMAGPTWRPAVGVRVQGEWIFSFHAISPAGADTQHVLAQVAVVSAGSRWRVGADFNRDPLTLGAPLLPANSVVCPPNAPTHPTRRPVSRYDYFVCSGNAATTGYRDTSVNLSDHYAVDFAF